MFLQKRNTGYGSCNWRILSANCKVLIWPTLYTLQVSFPIVCCKICKCVSIHMWCCWSLTHNYLQNLLTSYDIKIFFNKCTPLFSLAADICKILNGKSVFVNICENFRNFPFSSAIFVNLRKWRTSSFYPLQSTF